jgi:hypothetical protein
MRNTIQRPALRHTRHLQMRLELHTISLVSLRQRPNPICDNSFLIVDLMQNCLQPANQRNMHINHLLGSLLCSVNI